MTHAQRVSNLGQSGTFRLSRLNQGNGSGMSWAQSRSAMSRLMKLAEALRDIAEESSKHEIEQALCLCIGFADRVSEEPVGDAKGISLCPPTSITQRSLART